MLENTWLTTPYPFWEIPTPLPTAKLDFTSIIEGLLEDCAGQAGVLAMAAQHDETDEADVQFALRVLSEHLHVAVALWRQWREQEEAEATAEA